MSALTRLKLALAVVGIAIWGYGVRTDAPRVQWAGIALLAVAFALRFATRRPARRGDPRGPGSGAGS